MIVKTHQPDLLFLLETMVSEANTKRIIHTLGFENFDYMFSVNHMGGIWVLWNNINIMANVLLKEHRAIHMLVFYNSIQKLSVISGVYAPAQLCEKEAFWTHLLELNFVIDSPWCLIGDFNELEEFPDKKGGLITQPSRLQRSPLFLTSIGASSLPIQGRSFTWEKRIHGHLIYERLDRAIGRSNWSTLYPNADASHRPFTCSNHCHVLLYTSPAIVQAQRPCFRYQPN